MREQMERRLVELKKRREATLNAVHAFDGAIAECEYWLKKVDGSQPQVPPQAAPATEVKPG